MTRPKSQLDTQYLAANPLLRTTDLDEARHRIGQKFCDHRLELRSRGASLSVRHNHVAGRQVSVNYLHYGADVAIDPGMLGSFYLLQIPVSGGAIIHHRGAEIEASPTTASVLNPDRDAKMCWQGCCRKLLLQVDAAHVHDVAVRMTGAALPGPIRFDPELDLTTLAGRRLRRIVLACARAIEQGALFQGAMTGHDHRVEQDLARTLLTLQASNISHIIDGADAKATPPALRLAVDYIHANMSEPISLGDIATHAGINMRTLQKGFQRRYGMTPMRFLRNARLDSARYQLAARRDPPSVTSVAFANGFSHLGRFSRDFKNRFGHLPSRSH